MSDEHQTREMQDGRSFEERVFARLDAMGDDLKDVRTHLAALDDKVERRIQDTRPMWESVNARLERIEADLQEFRAETQSGFHKLELRLRVLNDDMLSVRGVVRDWESRVDKLDQSTV